MNLQPNDNSENIKILLVEDDVFIADSLKISLEGLGYDVAEPCLTIEDAHSCLKSHVFDLAILDINFYGKDAGISLGQYIHDHFNFPFIFLTAFSDAATVALATVTGPSAYLVKPASTATLFATIQTALYNHANHHVAEKAETNLSHDSFFIKSNGTIQRIYWKSISSIESSKNYAILSQNGALPSKIALRSTAINVLRLMPAIFSENFIQINRSCYVRINQISRVSKGSVWVGSQEFNLSNNYRKGLTDRLPIL